MTSNRVKTRETQSGEIIAYSESAVRQNLINVEYVKTSLACKFEVSSNCKANFQFLSYSSCRLHSRNSGTYRTSGIHLLPGFAPWILRTFNCENWLKLAKVFHIQKSFAYEWISWRSLHLHAFLDIYLWNGSRILDSNSRRQLHVLCYGMVNK